MRLPRLVPRPLAARLPRTAFPAAALGAVLAVAHGVGGAPPEARASAPADPPTFSAPTEITNPYFPVVPGTVKVTRGRSGSERTVVVELHLDATRDFQLGGDTVTCRAMQETEFEDGELSEISVNWFAQADDGAVWYFGETVDDYDDGEVSGHGGSWLVGGPGPGDPEETMTVSVPAVIMPGNPEVGDEWSPEDLPDGSQEVVTARRLDRRVRVPAGRFDDCLEVRELHLPDEETETKWYAPGIGFIRAKAHGENEKLEATSLVPSEE